MTIIWSGYNGGFEGAGGAQEGRKFLKNFVDTLLIFFKIFINSSPDLVKNNE